MGPRIAVPDRGGRARYAPRVTEPFAPDPAAILAHDGPLSPALAAAALDRADAFMASADFVDAARLYQRVVGHHDAGVTARALLGLGEAFHRLDDEAAALATWEEATRLAGGPWTYPAWRHVAAARVRAGDLRGALAAYRAAERIAPPEDRGEIANRLGWLSKELGDAGASGRYFARARGDAGTSAAAALVGLTVATSMVASFSGDVLGLLAMDKPAVAAGELWRLFSVALVHAPLFQNPLHLLFNMYALWLAGPLVERMYGRGGFLGLYAVAVLGGSLATYAFGDTPYGVGASGGVFGLFGLLFVAQRVHHPVVDRQTRAFMGQIGGLLALNLVFGLLVPGIDNLAHLGGLVAGGALGLLVAPGRVATLRSMWQRPGGAPGAAGGLLAARVAGFTGLALLLFALWAAGTGAWG